MRTTWIKRGISLLMSGVMFISCSTVGGVVTAFAEEHDLSANPQVYVQSGKTYGPWFGSSDVAYSNDMKGFSTIAAAITNAVGQWSPEPVSKAVGQALGPLFGIVAAITPDDYVYGNIHKRYREVYINGVFSYYQTEYTVTAWLHHDGKDIYGGETTEYYEGTSPMRLEA